MGDNSGIEWTDASWNPTTGCSSVSEGCRNCYARTQARRMQLFGIPAYQNTAYDRMLKIETPGFGLAMHVERLDQPLRWTRPRRIFVDSMSDLFHPEVTDEFIANVFAVMALARQHQFQVLTKRPERMERLLRSLTFNAAVTAAIEVWFKHMKRGSLTGVAWPLLNVWIGTSVEDQKSADLRIPRLLRTPAAIRFLSCEPLLGSVDLTDALRLWPGYCQSCSAALDPPDALACAVCGSTDGDEGPYEQRFDRGIHWVIAGGESGKEARPMHPDWPRRLRDQCEAAGVPFFYKQAGNWLKWEDAIEWLGQDHPTIINAHRATAVLGRSIEEVPMLHKWPDGTTMVRVAKKSHRDLDGETFDEMPEGAAV